MSDSAKAPTRGHSSKRHAFLSSLMLVAMVLLFFSATPFADALSPTAMRTLYLKLPIDGARFHWRFLDSTAFLSGELTLRILNQDHDQTLVVFRDGKIHDGWEMIGDAQPDGSVYFGFETSERVRTKADDSLIVTLKATQDLLGRGPYSEGVLPAGVWQMSGSYSSIYGERWNPMDYIALLGDPPVASMQCWAGEWPIRITKREGWNGTKQDDEPGLFRKMLKGLGTNLRACGSHY